MDKEDIQWLLSVLIPILYEEFRRRKKNKKKTPKLKRGGKK